MKEFEMLNVLWAEAGKCAAYAEEPRLRPAVHGEQEQEQTHAAMCMTKTSLC